jgi:hypothetical protein
MPRKSADRATLLTQASGSFRAIEAEGNNPARRGNGDGG